MMLKAHCKDCTKRYPGCHDKCDDYQSCRKKYNEAKKKKQEAQQVDIDVSKRIYDMQKRRKYWKK